MNIYLFKYRVITEISTSKYYNPVRRNILSDKNDIRNAYSSWCYKNLDFEEFNISAETSQFGEWLIKCSVYTFKNEIDFLAFKLVNLV